MTTIETLVPQQLWQAVEPLLPTPPPCYGGRPGIDDRACLAGIVYQLRTGIPWRLLPTRQLGCGSPVTCWRRLRDWQRAGVWQQLHHARCWTSSAARASWAGRVPASTRSTCGPSGGWLTGPNPTDRGKPGSKDHLLVDRRGIPLAVGLSAANTHDSMLLEAMVDAVPAVKGPRGRPGRPGKRPAKLHGDKGDDDPRCRKAPRRRGSRPGSPDVASSPASGWAGTGRWWSGRWPGWWAAGGCRSATSGAPTSCWGSSSLPARWSAATH